jgi:hypothetical protein
VNKSWIAVLCLTFSASLLARGTAPTPIPGGTQAVVVIDTAPPDRSFTGPGLALVPGTSYVIMQTKGGSLLLGPIFGGLNVERKTKELAQKSMGGYLAVDAVAASSLSLALVGIDNQAKDGALSLKPYAYVQQCGDDQRYRVALAWQVTAPGKKGWVNRYVAHLPSAIPYEQFLQPNDAQVAAFSAEMTAAADSLAQLLARDMRGELPAEGRKVDFGSLHLIGNKLGGAGIYTLAKDMWVPNVQLIEERDGNVVARIAAHPTSFWFGTHVMQRRLVHTLRPSKK